MNARQAYDEAIKIQQSNPTGLLFLIQNNIETAVEHGGFSVNVFTDGKHLEQAEMDSLRRDGFEVFWNSACLWYEVSWEHPPKQIKTNKK